MWGVYINPSLNQTTTAGRPPTKHRQYLNRLQRIFITETQILSSSSTTTIRLEFASSAWSLWLARDIEMIEKVQEKALKMTIGLKGKTYEEKCKKAGLETWRRGGRTKTYCRCSKY
jgi:hypothetical protein